MGVDIDIRPLADVSERPVVVFPAGRKLLQPDGVWPVVIHLVCAQVNEHAFPARAGERLPAGSKSRRRSRRNHRKAARRPGHGWAGSRHGRSGQVEELQTEHPCYNGFGYRSRGERSSGVQL